jgi:hypothetical protein
MRQQSNFATNRHRRTTGCLERRLKDSQKHAIFVKHIGDIIMTRDRIVEVTKKGAQRVAKAEAGTPAKQKYVKRLAELKAKRAVSTRRAADRGQLRA